MVPRPELVLIDFRYHIVSIAAVFLALGIGVATGAAVLDRVTVGQLEGQLNTLRDQLNDHRAEVTQLRSARSRAGELIDSLAGRVTAEALEGSVVVWVREGTEEPWQSDVRGAVADAGATDGGVVVLGERWALESAEDAEALRGAIGLEAEDEEDAEEARDLASEGGRLLGETLPGGLSAPLLEGLAEAGFLALVPGEDAEPALPVAVVVLGSEQAEPLASVALGAADHLATLAVSSSPDDLGPLGPLRAEGARPARLSTFDAAADDPGGVGVVLGLQASIDERGGHFGNGEELRFVPPPT